MTVEADPNRRALDAVFRALLDEHGQLAISRTMIIAQRHMTRNMQDSADPLDVVAVRHASKMVPRAK